MSQEGNQDKATQNKEIQKNALLFRSEDIFEKLYFKMYDLYGVISGEIYHTHDYMQIWYVKKGVLIHWLNNVSYKLMKGDVFILPPYVAHRIQVEGMDDINIIGLEFSSQFFNKGILDFFNSKQTFDFAYLEPFLVTEEIVKPSITISGDSMANVEALLAEMFKEYTEEKEQYELIIKAGLLKLLALIEREAKCGGEKSSQSKTLEKYREAIMNALSYIYENYNQPIRLEDACKKAALSKTYFCYMFKHFTDKTFSDYVVQVRIQKALQLLTETNDSIAGICYDVGFNDITHFCRTFKKNVGVSPNYYRKEHN